MSLFKSFALIFLFIIESVTIEQQAEKQIRSLQEDIEKYGYPFYNIPIYKVQTKTKN